MPGGAQDGGDWGGPAGEHKPDLQNAQEQPAAQFQALLPSNTQQAAESACLWARAPSAPWATPGSGGSTGTAASALPDSVAAPSRPQNTHQMLPGADDCSLGFLLQNTDDTPTLPSAAAQYQAPPLVEDSLMRGISDSMLGGECSLDAFAAGYAAQPVQVAAPGAQKLPVAALPS